MVQASEEHRQAPQPADVHHEQCIEHRHAENEDRRQNRHGIHHRVLAHHRQRPQHEAHEERPGVPQVDLRRVKIVPQEPDQAPRQRRQHHGDHGVVVYQGYHEEPQAGDHTDPADQPINDVDDVNGVDDADHPEDGERQVQPVGKRGDLDADAAPDQNEDRDELADQLGPGFEDPEIVDQAQHHHEGPAQDQPQDVLAEFEGQGQADQERYVDGEPAEVGNRFGLVLEPPVRTVHDVELQRGAARHRHSIQGQQQREDERQQIQQHHSTSMADQTVLIAS